MPSKKLTKEEIRTPDFFLSYGNHLAEFLLKHKNTLIAVIVLGLGAGLIWLGISSWQTHRENAASMALYPVEKKMQDEVEKSKTISDSNVHDYEAVLRSHASTRSAFVSLVTITPELVRAGKAAAATSLFQLLKPNFSNEETYFGLMKMTQGLVALENHQPDQALTIYQELLQNSAQKSFHPEAMLKMGVAYEMKNDFAKAREQFEKVHREHPATQAGELAFQYLLFLEQKKGA